MKLRLAYGWNEKGKFVLMVLDENNKPLHRISIARTDAPKIEKQIKFGRKGETRFIENHEQLI